MTELSLTVLDIANNSVSAGADTVEIDISINKAKDLMILQVKDNGKGIPKEIIDKVTQPFYTTRKTRKVGMGLPLLKQLCEQCEGSLTLESHNGTTITAVLRLSSVDRPPLGNMGESIITLIHSDSNIRFIFRYSFDDKSYELDTKEVKKIVGNDITSHQILVYLSEMINENINNINGGEII